MTDLQGLLERVEAAEGPDREIDCRLNWLWVRPDSNALTIELFEGQTWERRARDSGAERFTASIDSALALAERDDALYWIDVMDEALEYLRSSGYHPHQPAAPQIARAIISALIRARLAENTDDPA